MNSMENLTEKQPSALTWISISLVAILLLALNLFVMTPMLASSTSQGGSGFVYLAARVLIFVGLAYGLTRFGKRSRYQTLSTVMLIAIIDQVVFKALQIYSDMKANPEQWAQMGITPGTMIVGVGTGFLFFAPVVLVLGFLGVELGRVLAVKNAVKNAVKK